MASFNKFIGAGHLTRDPELSYTPKGTAVCKIGVAINESWKDANGEKKESVTFLDVTAFGKTGEAIAQYLKKGRPILFEGKLRTESWNDKTTNQPRSKLTVTLDSFQFLDSKESTSSERPTASRPSTSGVPTRPNNPAPAAETPEDDSEVPF